jgi:hypothetical protein
MAILHSCALRQACDNNGSQEHFVPDCFGPMALAGAWHSRPNAYVMDIMAILPLRHPSDRPETAMRPAQATTR